MPLTWRTGWTRQATRLVCPRDRRRPRAHSAVEEEVRLAVLALLPTENIVRAHVRDELVVDPDPRRTGALGEFAVRVQYVERVVPAGRRRAVVV